MSKELLLRHWENKFETIASNEFNSIYLPHATNHCKACSQSLQEQNRKQ